MRLDNGAFLTIFSLVGFVCLFVWSLNRVFTVFSSKVKAIFCDSNNILTYEQNLILIFNTHSNNIS